MVLGTKFAVKLPGFSAITMLLPLLIPVQLSAQQEELLIEDIARCAVVSNDIARHACFDGVTDHLRTTVPATGAITPPPANNAIGAQQQQLPVLTIPRNVARTQTPEPAAEVQENDELASFGTSSPGARLEAGEDGNAELVDRVTGIQEREPNKLLITLASGQVWYQVNSQRYRLREGMNVRIYPAPFGGSFRLAAEEINGFIQVRRVQ